MRLFRFSILTDKYGKPALNGKILPRIRMTHRGCKEFLPIMNDYSNDYHLIPDELNIKAGRKTTGIV